MKWVVLLLLAQLTMWSAAEEPPGTVEGDPPELATGAKETCERNKNQLESLKEIMMRSKQSLQKKEEEVQEYARRLSKIKSRAKLSRRSREGRSSPKDATPSKADTSASDKSEEVIDDISRAKTPKAKSSLLQKKLAENREAFERRSKEITESKRAVEEKVEAIRQQLDERSLAMMDPLKDRFSATPVGPVAVTPEVLSSVLQSGHDRQAESTINELNNKILHLEATIIDLKENLKEKDSVIESKTKAVTLMSADLSKKGKTTLDTLEDTKDEMRTMQQHFVLVETSLKRKNDNLLDQLHERDSRALELESKIESLENQLKEQRLSESSSANLTRSTMDALADTKDAMKSMQENFILMESSLKSKNDNLLRQLEDYEVKLAEANERVFQLESGAGVARVPAIEDLLIKLEKLEQTNRRLQDEKYELQKSIAEVQDRFISNRGVRDDVAIVQEGNETARSENRTEVLPRSDRSIEMEAKIELEERLTGLSQMCEEYRNKIVDLEQLVGKLEAEKKDRAARLPDEADIAKENEMVRKLTKELEESNKTMIKVKAQHRSKLKNLQKQLDGLKAVSDANAELVKLGNQVALLEEEKGNLQLSLVDFDELKAAAGDWQDRIAELEKEVGKQRSEIEMRVEAIAVLENQKLDLMQELHAAKREVSALEAENAESENLRVTAEMKVVDLEEQLEAVHRSRGGGHAESFPEDSRAELLDKLESLTRENSELYRKLAKSEEKGASDSGSSESFDTIHEVDRNELLKRIEDLTQRNSELTVKLAKLEEKDSSHAGSTESFEAINDTDKAEMLKKIEQLTQENGELTMKLSRGDEKGSSDAGSTESFERIPEHGESIAKVEHLTRENQQLATKLATLEERLSVAEGNARDVSPRYDGPMATVTADELSDASLRDRTSVATLEERNDDSTSELAKLRVQLSQLRQDNASLQERVAWLVGERDGFDSGKASDDAVYTAAERRDRSAQTEPMGPDDGTTDDDTFIRQSDETRPSLPAKLDESCESLKEQLDAVTSDRDRLRSILDNAQSDDFSRERRDLIDKLEQLNREKETVARERQELHEQISGLLHKSTEELSETRKGDVAGLPGAESAIVAGLEKEIERYKSLIGEQADRIEDMKMKLIDKEAELEQRAKEISQCEAFESRCVRLERESKDTLAAIEEWKLKCDRMQENVRILEEGKASIERAFEQLERQNERLLEESEQRELATSELRAQLEHSAAALSAKEQIIAGLKEEIERRDEELRGKRAELQSELDAVNGLRRELDDRGAELQRKDRAVASLSEELASVNEIAESRGEELRCAKKEIASLRDALRESRSAGEYEQLFDQLHDAQLRLEQTREQLDERDKENAMLSRRLDEMSRENDDIRDELRRKESELAQVIAELAAAQQRADAQLVDGEASKAYASQLRSELNDAYRTVERLKGKHAEEKQMQNQRLEEVVEELVATTRDRDALTAELERLQALVAAAAAREVAGEERLAELQRRLADSEDKAQAQLERMKKIAAALQKKKVACQELESRVVELEEKWTTEKDEKEANNKKIQEVESSVREKDNKIAELEEQLREARDESVEMLARADSVAGQLAESKGTIDSLAVRLAETAEQLDRLRGEFERASERAAAEAAAKERAIAEYEARIAETAEENERRQAVLDEAKENARELSVRMQVMEAEYMEQLALITNLKTENGLLSSRQMQISEKLENAEKESEERRLLVERLQAEVARVASTTTTAASSSTDASSQTSVDDVRDERATTIAAPIGPANCDRCEQCQNLVQALEAKLQEREAEIENLDNELANSIGNFVQMRESLRYNDTMNQSAIRNRSLEEPYNDLLYRYNALAANNEEAKAKLSDVVEDNRELTEKMDTLRSVNSALEERVEHAQRQLARQEETAEKLRNVESLYSDLLKSYHEQEQLLRTREIELDSVRSELGAAREAIENLRAELETYKRNGTVAGCRGETAAEPVDKIAIDDRDDDRDVAPKLFDASKIFGPPPDSDEDAREDRSRLRKLLEEREARCDALSKEIDQLQKQQSADERLRVSQSYDRCVQDSRASQERYEALQAERTRLERVVAEKDGQIDALTIELNNLAKLLRANGRFEPTDDRPNAADETLQTFAESRDPQSGKLRIAELDEGLERSRDNDARSATVQPLDSPCDSRSRLDHDLETAAQESDQEAAAALAPAPAAAFSPIADDGPSVSQGGPRDDATRVSPMPNASADDDEGWAWEVDNEAWGWNTEDAQPPVETSSESQPRVPRASYAVDSLAEDQYDLQIAIPQDTVDRSKEEHEDTPTEKVADAHAPCKPADVEAVCTENRELHERVRILEQRLQLSGSTPIEHGQPRKRDASPAKHEEQLDDLRSEMEALAAENEQLRRFLEEQYARTARLESRSLPATGAGAGEDLEETVKRNVEQPRSEVGHRSQQEDDALGYRNERSSADADGPLSTTRQNTDTPRANARLESETAEACRTIETLRAKADDLETKLRDSVAEKEALQSRLIDLAGTEEKLSAATSSLAELADLLNARVQEVADLKQELQKQYTDRQESDAKMQGTIRDLTRELDEKLQELDELREALNGESSRSVRPIEPAEPGEPIESNGAETVSAIVSEATRELVQMHAIQLEEKDQQLRQLTEKVTNLQSNQPDVDSLHGQIERLKENLSDKEAALRSAASLHARVEDQLSESRSESNERNEQLKIYKTQLEDCQARVDELQALLEEKLVEIDASRQLVESLRAALSEKEAVVERLDEQANLYKARIENDTREIARLREQLDAIGNESRTKTDTIERIGRELAQTRRFLEERESLIDVLNERLKEKQTRIDELLDSDHGRERGDAAATVVDGLPLFRMGGGDDDEQAHRRTVDELQTAIETKQQEIDHLKYVLSENTYPEIIREMQDRINCLYDERARHESSLRIAAQRLAEKEEQIESLNRLIDARRRESVGSEESAPPSRQRSVGEQQQQEIARLQNELHAKEQEINELRYVVSEKESQLSLQASMEPQSDEFQLREAVQRLNGELYGKEEELRQLRAATIELRELHARADSSAATQQRALEDSQRVARELAAEKEQIRAEAERLQRALDGVRAEKQAEIERVERRSSAESRKILRDLRLKESEMDDLKRRLDESSAARDSLLRDKDEQLARAAADLAEKERRLAELDLTERAEVRDLNEQLRRKDARIEELLAMSEEEARQLAELRQALEARDALIDALRSRLDGGRASEYGAAGAVEEVVSVSNAEPVLSAGEPSGQRTSHSPSSSPAPASSPSPSSSTNEFDFALYMLHQSDVRCEELTHELMQLLEERDTLQLRLSNAIRINEELRRAATSDSSPSKLPSTSSELSEPIVERASLSESEGPVEIAKEAIDNPVKRDKDDLALKLSQLHTVDHAKDVRLRGERELRHTQQMSLLAHKDVLSTLPPEAAARLVNANYTLSRDVQSQSSVLLNWLWGKSTPKVVHM